MHGTFIGTLVCSAGASAKDADATNKSASGSTAAIDFTGLALPTRIVAQSDVAFRLIQGSSAALAASNSQGTSYGPVVAPGQPYELLLVAPHIAAIPADGVSDCSVDLWTVSKEF